MNFFDYSFWQQFVANLLATFIGAGFGVLGALWLTGYSEKKTERERKVKILKSLHDELLYNHSVLCGWIVSENKEERELLLSAMIKDESWRAFSEGGELQWIKDPALLAELSNAYFTIRSLQTISSKYFSLLDENRANFDKSFVYNSLISGISHSTIEIDKICKKIQT